MFFPNRVSLNSMENLMRSRGDLIMRSDAMADVTDVGL